MQSKGAATTADHLGHRQRFWCMYGCASCGGMVMAVSPSGVAQIEEMWPEQFELSDTIPERARRFLAQALNSLHAPSAAVVMAASAVDAMLKDRGHKEGSLNKRIDQAAATHLITSEMAAWAHEIRLDANDERHADESAPFAEASDAEKVIEFATALAQFLYVLPARVERGRKGQPS